MKKSGEGGKGGREGRRSEPEPSLADAILLPETADFFVFGSNLKVDAPLRGQAASGPRSSGSRAVIGGLPGRAAAAEI